MAMIGIGVIGCGEIARIRYFPSLKAMTGVELVGVYSHTPSACVPVVRRYGGKTYADLDAFLRDPGINAVIVATPHPSHAELTVKALDAGKHVLTEKPMATSLADAARVREAVIRSRRVFMALPFDESPPMEEAKRIVQSGVIGQINSADAVLAHQGPVHARWFYDREKATWGVLGDLGIYLISQLTYLFGPAESVFGRVATLFPERISPDGVRFEASVDDNVAAVIVWPGNVLGSVRANWCSAAGRRNVIWDARVYGTNGMIFINMASQTDSIVVHAPGAPIEGAEKIVYNGMTECYRPILPAWDSHRDILRSFANAIARSGPTTKNERHVARQHHVIEIIANLYKSSETGTAQNVEMQY